MSDGGIWLPGTRHVASPNVDDRPDTCTVDLLVIHNISLPPDDFGGPWIEDLFLNRLDPDAHPYFATIAGLRVSAHLLVRRDGSAIQFVALDRRAWHAGPSTFEGRERCNDFSIGIELEGSDHRPFEPAQYRTLARLTREVMAYFPAIGPERIVGHSDIAPGRKTDPGACFDWPGFRHAMAQDVGGHGPMG
jgi:AmpD protein